MHPEIRAPPIENVHSPSKTCISPRIGANSGGLGGLWQIGADYGKLERIVNNWSELERTVNKVGAGGAAMRKGHEQSVII